MLPRVWGLSSTVPLSLMLILMYVVFVASVINCDWNNLVNYLFGIGYLPTDVLPPPSEEFDEASGIKKLIEYKFNEDGKKVKVLMAYFLFVMSDKCWLLMQLKQLFLPTRRYASAGLCDNDVSVRPSVTHRYCA